MVEPIDNPGVDIINQLVKRSSECRSNVSDFKNDKSSNFEGGAEGFSHQNNLLKPK